MPIPNAERAMVPAAKLRDYLLNTSHPMGGPKARWFISLGYHPSRPEELAAHLLDLVRREQEFSAQESPFGVKYIVTGRVVTPSGRIVNILTVWVSESADGSPRFVTAYPAASTGESAAVEPEKGDEL